MRYFYRRGHYREGDHFSFAANFYPIRGRGSPGGSYRRRGCVLRHSAFRHISVLRQCYHYRRGHYREGDHFSFAANFYPIRGRGSPGGSYRRRGCVLRHSAFRHISVLRQCQSARPLPGGGPFFLRSKFLSYSREGLARRVISPPGLRTSTLRISTYQRTSTVPLLSPASARPSSNDGRRTSAVG